MTVTAPPLADVEREVAALLAAEEVAALATLDETGLPSASHMHIAADGLVVYLHTLAHNRKYDEMLCEPAVSYVVSHLPTAGYAARDQVRSVQVKGRAELVTDPEEVALAVRVSREQFPWLADSKLYDHVKTPAEQQNRAFFRIVPVTALWSDHRVHVMWRTHLTFSADGRSITAMT